MQIPVVNQGRGGGWGGGGRSRKKNRKSGQLKRSGQKKVRDMEIAYVMTSKYLG